MTKETVREGSRCLGCDKQWWWVCDGELNKGLAMCPSTLNAFE